MQGIPLMETDIFASPSPSSIRTLGSGNSRSVGIYTMFRTFVRLFLPRFRILSFF